MGHCGGSGAAEPFVEQVWPPVAQRGRTARVELRGTRLEQALGVWTSTPGVLLSGKPVEASTDERAVVELAVPADAPLGIYGLRLATKSGLSNVALFVVDELPATAGPRDDLARAPAASAATPTEPAAVSLPACLVAPVRRARVDRYAIETRPGQRVTFEVIGNRLGKDFDPVVTIRDASGKPVARCDNSVGLFFDCRFAHTFAAGGRHVVEVADARYAADPHWNYVLRMGDFPEARTAIPSSVVAVETGAPGSVAASDVSLTFPQIPGFMTSFKPALPPRAAAFFQEVRFAAGRPATWIPLVVTNKPARVEQEPNDAPEAATAVELPASLCGVLDKPGDEDWFAFPLKKGESLRVRAESQRIGSAADLEIVLYEPTNDPKKEPAGREVLRNDETSTRDNERNTNFSEEANFAFSARTDGVHRVLVRDMAGTGSAAHTYRLDVGENLPELKVRAEATSLVVPRTSYQPLPLTITRVGFSGPVELELLGAPPGVTLESATVERGLQPTQDARDAEHSRGLKPTLRTCTVPAEANEFIARVVASADAPETLGTLQVVARAKATVNRPNPEKPAEMKPVEITLETLAATHPLIDRQVANKDRILTALRIDQRELPPSLTDRIALQITPPPPFEVDLADALVKLPKYQTADVKIVTKRKAGFAGPISFGARGGQLGDEREERVQVYFRAPTATPETPEVTGTLFNRILTQYQKHRVELVATAPQDGHFVTLVRTFQLDVHPAFDPKFEPAEIELMPGEKGIVKAVANRVPTFDGAIELAAQNPPGQFTAPETIPIAAGKAEAAFDVMVKPGTNPGRYQIRFETTGYVGKFQELVRNPVLTINVKKPPEKK